jgi:D-amino-acid dehydrogenase
MDGAQGGKRSIAVVGAGIVGVSTAIWLRRDGHDVTLIDARGAAEETSSGNAGLLASCSIVPVPAPGLLRKVPRMLFDPLGPLFLKWGYLPQLLPWLRRYLAHANAEDMNRSADALMPIIGDSVEQHLAIARGTEAERFITPTAYTFVYGSRDAYLKDGLAWNIRRRHGFEVEPSLAEGLRFAVQVPGHAYISDPGEYVRALARHAEATGVALRIATVEDFVLEAGRIRGVVTGAGPESYDEVVVAAGAWSARLAAKLGLSIPLEAERGYHLELIDARGGPSLPISLTAHKFVATPMQGRLRLAGLVEFGGLEAPASEQPYEMLLTHARAAFPGLTWSGERRWLGHRPATIDSVPVIGPVESVPGLHLAFGHQHVGLTGGPKTGRLVADLLAGRRPNIDMAPYRADRFG